MKHILTIIGARPQIIKAAAISRAIHTKFADQISETILHTGQHYDTNMSAAFFTELGIPEPDINLHVGSGSHGQQTAKMIAGIEEELMRTHYDGIILYGDTNSTLAGAVAASKLHVPIYHIEAGLRSYNMTMPEEINRIVCDDLSTILFAPTKTAVANLKAEGFNNSKARFADGNGRKVVLSGDVMYDNSMYFSTLAESRSHIMQQLEVEPKKFILATIHRDLNTDNKERLSNIFRALLTIAEEMQMRVVLPLHPRTAKLLPTNLKPSILKRVQESKWLCITEPAGFLDIIMLERNAALVMTDSGGVQKEAFFFQTPCVILRPETEWVEIVNAGAGIIADADYARILSAANALMGHPIKFPPLFGNAHAAERILTEIVK